MYTAGQAIGIRANLNKQWEIISTLNTSTVAELYTNYRRVQIELNVDGDNAVHYLDLDNIKNDYLNYTGTIADLLLLNGNTTLPTSTTGFVLDHVSAVYSDAFKAGYNALPVTVFNVEVSPVDYLNAPNLRLVNNVKNVDYNLFYKACLVSVCGYLHQIDTDGTNGIMLIDAMKTMVKSGENQIGLLSFTDVCDLLRLTITQSMIVSVENGVATITTTQNTENFTSAIVIGGTIYQLDGVIFSQLNNYSFTVNFNHIDVVSKFLEANDYLDLSSLGIDQNVINEGLVNTQILTTPEVIAKWLLLSQSFLLIFKNNDIYFQRKAVRQTGLPSRYVAYEQPTSLLELENSRLPAYIAVREDTRWSINLRDGVVSERIYNSVSQGSITYTSRNLNTGYPGKIAKAALLEIGRDIKSTA